MDAAEEYRQRKMMQSMLERGATAPPPAAGRASVAAPLAQLANAAGAAYNQHRMGQARQAAGEQSGNDELMRAFGAPAASLNPGGKGAVPPPTGADPNMLQQLMASFKG